MYGDRDQMRRQFLDVRQKMLDSRPLVWTPLEQQIAAVIREHPEYHALFDDREQALNAEFPPEGGVGNPFLHLSMHLGIREQVATDRPAGIGALFEALAARHDPLEAEHRMTECLGRALWEAQRAGAAPDEAAYLECLRQLR